MRALPLIVSAAVAWLLVPAALRALTDGGLVRENYRGAALPFPAGIAVVAAAALALIVLAPLDEIAGADVIDRDLRTLSVYVVGVSLLGFFDDVLGAEPRGWRGHGAAILGGGLSSGALKAAGSLGLALLALGGRGYDDGQYLLAVLLLVLTTNLFNLLDLRPGRSIKAFVALAAVLTIASRDTHAAEVLGLFAGPAAVIGLYDVRERAMIGDTGSNAVGALAGLWMVLTLSTTGQAIALALVAGVTIYGEFRSITALVERTPLLRRLDSLGNPHA